MVLPTSITANPGQPRVFDKDEQWTNLHINTKTKEIIGAISQPPGSESIETNPGANKDKHL